MQPRFDEAFQILKRSCCSRAHHGAKTRPCVDRVFLNMRPCVHKVPHTSQHYAQRRRAMNAIGLPAAAHPAVRVGRAGASGGSESVRAFSHDWNKGLMGARRWRVL